MIWKSSYDYMQDNVAQILEAKQGISLELIIDENNSLHKIKENYNARRIVEVSKRQNELEKEKQKKNKLFQERLLDILNQVKKIM